MSFSGIDYDNSKPVKFRSFNLQPPKKRVKTGCLTCRTRKKKCSEKKPVCDLCLKSKLECRWPQPIQQQLAAEQQESSSSSPPPHKIPRLAQDSGIKDIGQPPLPVSPISSLESLLSCQVSAQAVTPNYSQDFDSITALNNLLLQQSQKDATTTYEGFCQPIESEEATFQCGSSKRDSDSTSLACYSDVDQWVTKAQMSRRKDLLNLKKSNAFDKILYKLSIAYREEVYGRLRIRSREHLCTFVDEVVPTLMLSYTPSKFSLYRHLVPCAQCYPPSMEIFLAYGVLFRYRELNNQDLINQAVLLFNHGADQIKSDIVRGNLTGNEGYIFGTICLLYLFEIFDGELNIHSWQYTRLVPHIIQQWRLRDGQDFPSSQEHAEILWTESYIYHTVMLATMIKKFGKDLAEHEYLFNYLKKNVIPQVYGDEYWLHSPILGPTHHVIRYLAEMAVFQGFATLQESQINRIIEIKETLIKTDIVISKDGVIASDIFQQVYTVYRNTGLIFASKLLSRGKMDYIFDYETQLFVAESIQALTHLSPGKDLDWMLDWPLLILGSAAVDMKIRQDIIQFCNNILNSVRKRSAQRAIAYLSLQWTKIDSCPRMTTTTTTTTSPKLEPL